MSWESNPRRMSKSIRNISRPWRSGLCFLSIVCKSLLSPRCNRPHPGYKSLKSEHFYSLLLCRASEESGLGNWETRRALVFVFRFTLGAQSIVMGGGGEMILRQDFVPVIMWPIENPFNSRLCHNTCPKKTNGLSILRPDSASNFDPHCMISPTQD